MERLYTLICLGAALVCLGGMSLTGCDGEDGEAPGALDDSEVSTDEAVDTSQGTDSEEELYPSEDLWPEVESLLVGDSMFGFCFGTNKDFRDRFHGTHSFYVVPTIDQTENYRLMREGKIQEMSYGVLNYTTVDPSNVEDPNQNNIICVASLLRYDWENYWHWYEEYKNYEDFKFSLAMTLLDRLEVDLEVDFSSHIEVLEIFTPLTMQGFTLNPGGSIFGWSMIPEQTMKQRMPQQTPIENLLLAGAWTYPGGGQSASIVSGLLAGIKILEKDGQKVPEFPPHDPPLRGINAEWFDNLGILEELTVECSETIYRSMYLDMREQNRDFEFAIPSDPETYRIWLKERYPEDADGIDRLFQYLYDMERALRIIFKYDYAGKKTDDPEVMAEIAAEFSAAGTNMLDFLMNELPRLMDGVTLTDFMKPYTTNQELISMFTMLSGMAGEGPDDVDAMFFLAMWVQYHLGGFCYVHGGSQAISDALAKVIRDNNTVRINTLVTKIDIDDEGKASTVRTADGTCYKTRYVISNANAPDTFFKMVGYEHLPVTGINEGDPNWQFHPGRIWQPPISEKPAAPVEVRTNEKIDQLTGATPTAMNAVLTDKHAGFGLANCLSCHNTDAHPVAALGNNASGYTDAQCTTCHGNNGSPVATAAHHASQKVNDDCGTCHTDVHQGLGYKAPDDCRACHKFNDANYQVGQRPECVVTEEGYDVVIIGAGAGGLGAGSYLSMQGYNVIVLEKHHKVGGYMTNYNRGKYRFEISTHGFDGLHPDPYGEWNVPVEE